MAENKVRIQLDFSKKGTDELDELKKKVGAASRAEVIRSSMRWFDWCADEVAKGAKIIIERDGHAKEIVFPFSVK